MASAWGQGIGPGVTIPGAITSGDCASILSRTQLQDSGGTCGGSTLNVKAFGATGNFTQYYDGTMVASSSAFSSQSATFTSADVGKNIVLIGSGTTYATQTGTITGFTDAHDITVSFTSVNATPWDSVATATVTTAQSGAGSYAPADTVTIVGGTTVTTAAQFTVRLTNSSPRQSRTLALVERRAHAR